MALVKSSKHHQKKPKEDRGDTEPGLVAFYGSGKETDRACSFNSGARTTGRTLDRAHTADQYGDAGIRVKFVFTVQDPDSDPDSSQQLVTYLPESYSSFFSQGKHPPEHRD